MSNFAVVDAGSNSVKLLIASRSEDGVFDPICQRTVTTRLGEGIHLGRLREAAIRRTLDAFEDFKSCLGEFEVEGLCAVGTSAIRDAENRGDLIARATEIGIPLEAISGEEEARLSFNAVRLDPVWRKSGPLMVIDIGGGSTEVIEGTSESEHLISRVSLPVGAVRLSESILLSDPPTILQLHKATELTQDAFGGVEIDGSSYTAVGVGGTLTTMAAVHLQMPVKNLSQLHGHKLSSGEVERQVDLYASTALEQRREIVGLDPARADIILGGSLTLKLVMQRMNLSEIAVSTRGLRWGVMYDRFLNFGKKQA